MTDERAVQERFRTALELFDLAVRMVRQSALRRNPQATEADLEAAVDAWLRHRPGAEHGDAPGRPVAWPRPPR